MNKGIFTLYRNLTDTNTNFCCLCYNNVNEETACVQDNVVLGPNREDDTSNCDEEVGIHFILQQILGSKVAACLSNRDAICDKCTQSAINSYKFIKMCHNNTESMANSVEAFKNNLDITEGMDMQEYQSMFMIMDFEESKCTQYYDTAKFTDRDAALYKFQTLFRPYRTIKDKKGNIKYKCTKCPSIFLKTMNAVKHFNIKHNENHEQILKDETKKCFSDDESDICRDNISDEESAPDWTERYNSNNVRRLNELSHEVIIDCDGLNKYKCRVCSMIFASPFNARKHYKSYHIPISEIAKSVSSKYGLEKCKRRGKKRANENKKNEKPAFLTKFNYCRENIKHLNEISHIVIKDSSGSLKYKCRECSTILSYQQAARRHYLKYHVEEIKFEEESVKKEDDIVIETKRNNSGVQFPCVYCNKTYDNKYILIEHLLKEHGFTNSEMSCETTLKDIHLLENDIYNHIYTIVRDENGCEKFRCKLCLKSVKNFRIVRAHFINIHVKPPAEEEQYICSQCGKGCKTIYLLNKHEECHVDAKLTCEMCCTEFKNKYALRDHIKNRCLLNIKTTTPKQKSDSQTIFTCNECGKTYSKKDSLRTHIKYSHDPNAIKYPCLHCPKVFCSTTRLKFHQVTHTRERNFTCDICGDVFCAKNALVYHTRIHTGERPYKCTYCDSRFLSASRRADHVNRHHIAAMATCSLCGITIKQTGMRKHLRRHKSNSKWAGKTSLLVPVKVKGKTKAKVTVKSSLK